MNASDPLYERDTALQREIYREKVERARSVPVTQRFLLGPQLFDMGMQWMRSGIRSRHPEFNEEQVDAEVERRMRIADRLRQSRNGRVG